MVIPFSALEIAGSVPRPVFNVELAGIAINDMKAVWLAFESVRRGGRDGGEDTRTRGQVAFQRNGLAIAHVEMPGEYQIHAGSINGIGKFLQSADEMSGSPAGR